MTTAHKDNRETLAFALAAAFTPQPPPGATITVGFVKYGCFAAPINLTLRYTLGASECRSTIPRSLINGKPDFYVTMVKNGEQWTLEESDEPVASEERSC